MAKLRHLSPRDNRRLSLPGLQTNRWQLSLERNSMDYAKFKSQILLHDNSLLNTRNIGLRKMRNCGTNQGAVKSSLFFGMK